MLDVACGTGNAAIRAAEAGGRVVGLDLAPELFDAARARAAEAGVDVDWVEGDAEALPYPDERFDVVLSTFGCPWVPRHETDRARDRARPAPGRAVRTDELDSGGRGWGVLHDHRCLCAAAAGVRPPPALWGDEGHVRELFADTGIELEFVRDTVVWRFDSLATAVETFVSTLGPLVIARESLEPQGRWPALRAEIAAWLERWNRIGAPRVEFGAEYLLVLGLEHGPRRPAATSPLRHVAQPPSRARPRSGALKMATIAIPARRDVAAGEHLRVGPVGRLGRFAADHVRAVLIVWAIVAVALAAFAPKVETALSGAGWQADGSESVQARTLIQRSFGGLSSAALTVVVHSSSVTTSAPEFQRTIQRVERGLAGDERVASVQRPRRGASVSPDGHTAIVTAGAKGNPAARSSPPTSSSRSSRPPAAPRSPSRSPGPGIWSDFNTANRRR